MGLIGKYYIFNLHYLKQFELQVDIIFYLMGGKKKGGVK